MPDLRPRFKHFLLLIASAGVACAHVAPSAGQAPPLASGDYVFTLRFAEQPGMPGTPVAVRIDGDHVVIHKTGTLDAFPQDVIAEGTLMWHAASGQWIVADKATDRSAAEVGGCSGGPDVVDLDKRIFWTC